ncbi:hypothetical protein A2U01_0109218, partial [Trifolium medium]|nr:hypothetical protein [Trifolium medium]
ARRAKVDEGN